MEFAQRTTLTAADWQQWTGRNVAVRDGGIELARESTDGSSTDSATDGVVYRQFDAGSEAVQWHRLVVDHQQSAAGTQLRVAYVASDESMPVDDSLAAVEAATEGRWQTASATDDVLLASATGQYLTVRIELVGTERASPRVESVRASWPRQSYLQYLPELYQKEGKDGLLEQYLAVFGTLFVDLEREIKTTTELFDPHAVPAEALPWLAEWLGVETPDSWPTAAIRARLARAPDHQPTRGTKDGLRNMLALYLAHIEPTEPLASERLVPSENTTVGMDVDMNRIDHGLWILEAHDLDEIGQPAVDAYSQPFSDDVSVVVYAGPFEQPAHRQAAEQVLDLEIPAHVESRLVEITGEWRLGVDGFLSETSRLADSGFELGGTRLGSAAELTRIEAGKTAELD